MNAIDTPLLGISQRLPPTNIEAEQAVLGAILMNNRAFERVVDILRPEHFADPAHAAIYTAAARRIAAGGVADPITLRAALEHTNTLNEVGGTQYLGKLLSAVVGIVNVPTYALAIRDAWMRRKVIEVGEDMVNRAFGAEPACETAADAIKLAITELDRLHGSSSTARGPVSLASSFDEAIAAGERAAAGGLLGLSSGLRCIDEALGGLEPGCLYILAGRPGMGKSALGVQIAVDVAKAGQGVLVKSLEMQAAQIGRRALSYMSGVPTHVLRRGGWGQKDAQAIVRARTQADQMPLTISDQAGETVAMIGMGARSVMRKHPVNLLVLDHLHIVGHDDGANKHGETWAVGKISTDLKRLAKDLNIPIIALAQLNRGVEGREDKRPTMGDLRQSGNIEQDADAIMFPYRPEYYLSKSEPEHAPGTSYEKHQKAVSDWHDARERLAGLAEINFAKVREGELSTVHLRWDGAHTCFRENQI